MSRGFASSGLSQGDEDLVVKGNLLGIIFWIIQVFIHCS